MSFCLVSDSTRGTDEKKIICLFAPALNNKQTNKKKHDIPIPQMILIADTPSHEAAQQ